MEDDVFWTDSLRARVLPWRGGPDVPLPPPPDAVAAWRDVRQCWKERIQTVSARSRGRCQGHEVLRRVLGRTGEADPQKGTVEEDAAQLAVLAWDPGADLFRAHTAPIELAAATGGLAHAVAVAMAAIGLRFEDPHGLVHKPPQWRSAAEEAVRGLSALRGWLAGAPDAVYAAAEAAVTWDGSPDQAIVRGFLFPTRLDWAEEALAHLPGPHGELALSAVTHPEQLRGRRCSTISLYPADPEDSRDIAATLVAACGLDVVPLLAGVFWPPDGDPRRHYMLLAALGNDDAVRTLVANMGRRDAELALADAVRTQPTRVLRCLAERKLGDAARSHLRTVARQRPDAVRETLPTLPAEVRRFLEVELDREGEVSDAPAERLPACLASTKARALEWLPGESLPRVLLADRMGALPTAATRALLGRLKTGADVAEVRAACDPGSIGAFLAALVDAWQANGAPSRDGWCLRAVAALGDDDAARALAARIRAWAAEGLAPRAMTGLSVLAAMESDLALVLLAGFGHSGRPRRVQDRANKLLDEVAEARGLTRDALEDLVVPDLGLAPDGRIPLDFGPRAFRVGFDAALRPDVRDDGGHRLRDLPKPRATDDPARAEAAQARFKQLKADARRFAPPILARMERALRETRRIPAAAFLRDFVRHPFVGPIARGVLWATVDGDGAPIALFRIAEDRTFADVNDDPFHLPETAHVAIPHPLHLDDAAKAAWSRVFADYELAQPFRQLTRATFAQTAAETGASELTRVRGVSVVNGRIFGLQARGWRLGPAEDNAMARHIAKEVAPGIFAALQFDPGICVPAPNIHPVQTLETVALTAGRPDRLSFFPPGTIPLSPRGKPRFGMLDPVAFSELVLDVEDLR